VHKDLIRLRRERSELSDGNLNAVNVRFNQEAQWLVLERGGLRVACNLGQATVEVEVGCCAQLLLASEDSIGLSGKNIKRGQDSVAIVSLPSSSLDG
jgi:maltooligosyltrehalose trehalohydrolase